MSQLHQATTPLPLNTAKDESASPTGVNGKPIVQIELLAEPPLARAIFECLAIAGLSESAIFGGAVRDADCSAAWATNVQIRDYDVRAWLPEGMSETQAIEAIERAFCVSSHAEMSLGTGRPRCCFDFEGVEIDLSFRPRPKDALEGLAAAAIDRALDSDAALSSIAIDPKLRAWARPEYLADRDGGTLSFFPIESPQRETAYIEKMTKKFPDRVVQRIERELGPTGLSLNQAREMKEIVAGSDPKPVQAAPRRGPKA